MKDSDLEFYFAKDYFCDESIDGFLVTEAMKRYWAASLRTLYFFDRVCEKYKLRWWADWGTLLGAVRHKGFVPWDDDLDVGMPRKDYMTFLSVAEKELPYGYATLNYDCPGHKYTGLTVVLNHLSVSFDEGMLNEYYNCPFPVGFDLYPYEYMPDSEQERQRWRLDGMRYLAAMEYIRTNGIRDKDTVRRVNELPDAAKSVFYSGDADRILREYGQEVDRIAGRYDESDGDNLITYTYYIRDNNERYIDASWVSDIEGAPFESGSINIPTNSDAILRKYYGDEYMTPRQVGGAHDYPLYKRDIRAMIDFLAKGGLGLSDLPAELSYIRREAEYRGIE